MKRSEMVMSLANDLWVSDGRIPHQYPLEEYLEKADRLLGQVEDLGMEPPKAVYWNLDKNGTLQASTRNGDLINYWEPENE